jgi:uncharacterized protein YbjT (DUF2867 family)
MRVVIFGASGMVGSGVLLECLDDERVTRVLVVGRSPCGVTHPKLEEVLHADFFDYTALRSRFAGLDACFFCLGVSAARLDEPTYRRLTRDLTLAAARALLDANPRITFCYVSGQGTDAAGRMMWARVKGETENALLALPFTAAYMLRPGIIQPLKGVRSKTRLYQAFYSAARPLFPVLRRALPGHVTTSVAVGRAMIHLAIHGDAQRILETPDITRLGAAD